MIDSPVRVVVAKQSEAFPQARFMFTGAIAISTTTLDYWDAVTLYDVVRTRYY